MSSTLTDEERWAVARAIRELTGDPPGRGAESALAEKLSQRLRELGHRGDAAALSQQVINKAGKAQLGFVVAKRIAVALGTTLDDLVAKYGEPVTAAAPERTIEREDRFAAAQRVVEALVARGHDRERAKRAVGSVAFDEGATGSDEFALFEAAQRVLLADAGRPEVGVREVTDDDEGVPPKRRGRR